MVGARFWRMGDIIFYHNSVRACKVVFYDDSVSYFVVITREERGLAVYCWETHAGYCKFFG